MSKYRVYLDNNNLDKTIEIEAETVTSYGPTGMTVFSTNSIINAAIPNGLIFIKID